MATTAMDYESANGDRYDDEPPRYERDQRSASPRAPRDDGMDSRRRSASPGDHVDRPPREENGSNRGDDEGAVNPGSNLFVTGIHPRLNETEVTRLFEKYGEVEKCQIMKDPHSKESRGFGFVKMVTSDQADAAKDGLQGEVIEGRTLSIEKARRSRPRTPTPGKYFGPPKREGGGDRGGRFNDRRRGGYGGRDDSYRQRGYDRPRYEDRYERGAGGGGYREDRGYGGRYDRGYDRDYDRGYSGRDDRGYSGRDDRGYGRRDRGDDYASERYGGRDDRYERRGGAPSYDRGDRYERAERTRDPAPSGYAESGSRADPRDTYGAP